MRERQFIRNFTLETVYHYYSIYIYIIHILYRVSHVIKILTSN